MAWIRAARALDRWALLSFAAAWQSNEKRRNGMEEHRKPMQWLSTEQLGKAWI
jgi:hypothetical protein